MLNLKPEDRPELPPTLSLVPPMTDPQSALIDLMDVLGQIDDARDELQKLFTRWGHDPVAVMQRAQARTLELQQLVAQARPVGETLAKAMRASGQLSAGRW